MKNRSIKLLANLPHPSNPSQCLHIHRRNRGLQTSTTSSAAKPSFPKTIFSGIQPTGTPHLGNYLGALRQWVDFQNLSPSPSSSSTTTTSTQNLFFCIVDLHAITQAATTTPLLRQWKKQMFMALLAIGLDPERCVIYEQSRVAGHTELMWVLGCAARMGYLGRMTQWKSKIGIDESEDVFLEDDHKGGSVAPKLNLGMFSYPVLQAADILLHKATHVPVGEDQVQHLELTRKLASTFHLTYNTEIFPRPETVLSPAKKIMSLRDPSLKMSKSHTDPNSRILLTDTPSEISSKITKSITDSEGPATYDPTKRPGVANLMDMYAHMQRRDNDMEGVARELEGLQMSALKKRVAECVIGGLERFRREYERIEREGDGFLVDLANRGARVAGKSAEETMVLVRDAIGLR